MGSTSQCISVLAALVVPCSPPSNIPTPYGATFFTRRAFPAISHRFLQGTGYHHIPVRRKLPIVAFRLYRNPPLQPYCLYSSNLWNYPRDWLEKHHEPTSESSVCDPR